MLNPGNNPSNNQSNNQQLPQNQFQNQNNPNINMQYQQQPNQQNQNQSNQQGQQGQQQQSNNGFDGLKQKIFQKLKQAKLGAQEQFTKFQGDYKNMMTQKKNQIKDWFRGKVQVVLEKLLKQGRPGLKKMMKDPYMPMFVKDVVDDVVDENWPIIEANVMDSIGVVELHEDNIMEKKKPTNCQKYNPILCIRNWYLYSLQPYDKSIWYCLKTFSWWFFQALKICPFYSIQNYFYVFVFLCIDKSDEWQLVRFILEFKAFQFLSVGSLGSIIGFLKFYNCATLNEYKTEEESLQCTKIGPQAELYDLIGFIVIIVLIWIAYSLLPCSEPKGQWKQIYVRQQNEEDFEVNEEADCCCCTLTLDKGGRLKGFMIYDFLVFLFVVALFLVLYIALEKNEKWQQQQILYLTKTLYGLLMVPFIIFVIPQFNEILTRCRETGYDKYGNCLPRFIEDEKQRQKRLEKQKNNILSNIEEFDFDNNNNVNQQYQQQQL